MFRSLRISHVEFDSQARKNQARLGMVEWNGIFRNFRPTSREYTQNFGTKFRKMTVPFAPQPGISGIFGRMQSALGYVVLSLVIRWYNRNRTTECLKRLKKRSIDDNLRQLVLIRQDRLPVN